MESVPLQRAPGTPPPISFQIRSLRSFWTLLLQSGMAGLFLTTPELNPFLNGGLVLSTDDQGVIAEPTCCSDLSNIESWVQAASFKGDQWKTVWIGHPYPSMKYRAPDLILSELHESEAPVERWSVLPGELLAAVKTAETELHRFAKAIVSILTDWGVQRDVHSLAKHMAGLTGGDG